jgi:glycerol kinase
MPNFPVLKNELETLKSMYSFKSDSWQYEQEIRYVKVVTGNKSPYLPIRVKAVFIGMNASGKQERLIRKIIDMLNRTRKEQIEVKRMTPDNIKIFSTW